MTELVKFNQAYNAIMEARSIDEVKEIRDKAEALRLYLKQQGQSLEMQNSAAEIKLRAERRAGELLAEMPKNEGTKGQLNGRDSSGGSTVLPPENNTPTLEDFGLNKFQSSRFQTIASLPEQTFEEYISTTKAMGEELTSAGARRLAKNGNLSQPMEILLSHKSVNYYTPSEYIEAAREVMGSIDLDPASCEAAQVIVKAGLYYDEQTNGLNQVWFGNVWLNPPYSKTDGISNQSLWAERLISEYQSGNVSQGILLVKSALGYNWFEEIWDRLPVCFVRNRLSFIKSDGSTDGQSKHGTAIFYIGEDVTHFISVFSKFGRITTPAGEYYA